jgi:hypothetical protein
VKGVSGQVADLWLLPLLACDHCCQVLVKSSGQMCSCWWCRGLQNKQGSSGR